MAISRLKRVRVVPNLSLILLAVLLLVLWLAGGASREDVSGQIVTRVVAWMAIVVMILFAPRPRIAEAIAPALVLLAAIMLCVAQLIPLPPGLWRMLPGRAVFTDPLVSPPDLWRPWSLVPGATVNALLSLVVPLAVLMLTTGIRTEHRRRIPALVLMVIALALVIGLLQFTGAQIINPLVNGTPGAVDGMIANRNHFALILAIGLLIIPVWGVGDGGSYRMRGPVALGGVLLLVLTILASGSRAGIALGMVALTLGLLISRQGLKSALRHYPRWTLPAICFGIVGVIALFVFVSVAADRAVSINRLVGQDAELDLRARALPVVLTIVRTYFPFGAGLGSFDPIFRLHEPFALLKPTYFNHVHNDFIEIVLTAGLPGLLLMVAATGWWAWRSVGAWRGERILPKLGSAVLLLILLASVVDYPARIPLVMAMAMIGAIWLGTTSGEDYPLSKAALPSRRRKL